MAASAAFAATPLPALDLAISKYLGTTRQEEIMVNRIVPYAGAHIGGVHVDTSKNPPRIYLFDSANNRILGFNGWKPATLPNGPYPCADIVIGQPALWDAGSANGNSTQFLPPTAATLALMSYPFVSSVSESPRSSMMATDAAGNFYVVDLCNNRVLKYIDPFVTDQIADDVWGQATFTNRSPDNTRTPPPPRANTLSTQSAYSSGVEVDADGNIWVADTDNSRVLCFTNGAKTATLVLGQPTFTNNGIGTALHQMNRPSGVRVHPQTHEVFVLDGRSDMGSNPLLGPRMMVFRPPFSNGMCANRTFSHTNQFGTNLLFWSRGFCLDPCDANIVWVADGANNRIIKFNHVTGQPFDCIGQQNLTTFLGIGKYVRPDGAVADFGQPNGGISIDAQTNLYFTGCGDLSKVIRVPLPITSNAQGYVWSNGEMMKCGLNATSGRTSWDNYGMARWNNQLFVHDRYRILVWTNYPTAVNFQSADFVIGQSAMDQNDPGGTFEGCYPNIVHASSNVLFVVAGGKLFMFHLPITGGGRNYAPFRTIDGNQANQLKWADDNSDCAPMPFGNVCYDPVSNVLWNAQSHAGNNNPGSRVLRIRDPFAALPQVDLVLGQTNKTGGLRNKGKWIADQWIYTVDATDMADPTQVYLDNYRNLYVVDSGYEGGGNCRVVRFNEAKTYPIGGTIFPNTAADAVFCKPNLTAARDSAGEANRPGTPITLAFNSANEMVLTGDTYDTPQGMHLFLYPTPQTGAHPQPTHIINTYLGQPAFCFFDGPMFVLQDHTWNRIIFHVPRATAPLVDVTNTISSTIDATTAIGGTNVNLVGTMQWTNERGGNGAFPATSPWQVTGIPLQFGGNLLTVSGTNTSGMVGSDSVTITRDVAPGDGTSTISSTPLPALDFAISKCLGTTRQEEIILNRIVPYAGAHIGGVHVDTSKNPARIYLFDSANNRILGFKGWQPATLPNGPYPCADIVIGQPGLWDAGSANGNSTQFLPPTAATLALMSFPFVSSSGESPRSSMMATDAAGNFYLVDLCNNRVLRYDDPFETDQIADHVWGQRTFTNRSPNNTRTTSATGTDTLHTQSSPNSTRTPPTISADALNTQGAYTSGVEVDAAGNLWVADTGNNRVICFTNGATTATLVLGQATFAANGAGTALNQMYHPSGVRVHPQTREVFVLDGRSDRWPGPRVMVFRPPFSNGMRAQRVFGTNQLNWARGFCLDPFDANIVWVADGANNRIIQFNHRTGQALDCIGQPNLTTFIGIGKYVRPDGAVADFGQPDGSISIDAHTNLYFTSFHDFNKVIRIPLPITRNAEGHVWSNGEMMKQGVNENSGRTMWGNYGMARWHGQLFVRDRYRIMVWTNYPTAVNFQSADFVIGQSAMDQNKPGGTFEGREIGMLHASSNVLFVTSDATLFMFHLPLTNGGRDYAPFKTIDGGQATELKWADDRSACTVLFGGVCYDPLSNVLWVAHNHSGDRYPGARVLRIRDPFAITPLVDLVLGQTNKTGGLKNKGKYSEEQESFTVDATDMANPAHVFLDNYRNLYVVDSGYEGRIDNAGNRRVVRFDEAHTYPVGGTIFPNTPADAVFCKPTLTTTRDYVNANRPNTPITLTFNSANAMVLTDDTYDTPQGMHLFYYPAPQTGAHPQPTQIINTYLGQPAFCFFDGPLFVLQDHTWNRILFHVPRATVPLVDVTNSISTVTSASTAVGGTTLNVVGTMQWINERGGAGSFPATSPWQVTGIALQFGGNLV